MANPNPRIVIGSPPAAVTADGLRDSGSHDVENVYTQLSVSWGKVHTLIDEPPPKKEIEMPFDVLMERIVCPLPKNRPHCGVSHNNVRCEVITAGVLIMSLLRVNVQL